MWTCLQDFIGLRSALFVLDEDLVIRNETAEVFAKILHLHLPLDPVGFHHPADGEKIFLHSP
jgi:hypothetical protein